MIFHWLTERRRARLLATRFPEAWCSILERNVRAYQRLSPIEQQRLRDLVTVFIAEKRWEGCAGLQVTDEMRVTIAGSACLLLLGRDHDLMRDVESILIYPSAVLVPAPALSTLDARPRVVNEATAALGVAIGKGPVVLAWDAVLSGAVNPHDGRNVVIHEMAHKVDFLDGEADGTPPLESRQSRREWARVCEAAFLALKDGQPHLLRDYAATNEAEFFAVASEVFFEKPSAMAREMPELYRLLRGFFQLDPAQR